MPFRADRLTSIFRRSPKGLRLLAGLAAVLLWVFWPTCCELVHRWGTQSQYSHGYLVPAFSLYLLWSRRGILAEHPLEPSWWGLPLLGLGLAARFGGVYIYFDWLTAAALLPCLAGACLLAGGWRTLHWAWPAIAFLIFMIPLPFRLETALSHPLQRIGTIITTFTLQTLGMAAYAEGNVIVFGEHRIGVVEACSGLNMLMTFFALASAVAFLIARSPLERVLIFLSAVPIAIAANILRIIVTAIMYRVAGAEVADLVFHKLFGYLMPLPALAMLWVLLRLLSWLLVPGPSGDAEQMVFGWTNPVRGVAADTGSDGPPPTAQGTPS